MREVYRDRSNEYGDGLPSVDLERSRLSYLGSLLSEHHPGLGDRLSGNAGGDYPSWLEVDDRAKQEVFRAFDEVYAQEGAIYRDKAARVLASYMVAPLESRLNHGRADASEGGPDLPLEFVHDAWALTHQVQLRGLAANLQEALAGGREEEYRDSVGRLERLEEVLDDGRSAYPFITALLQRDRVLAEELNSAVLSGRIDAEHSWLEQDSESGKTLFDTFQEAAVGLPQQTNDLLAWQVTRALTESAWHHALDNRRLDPTWSPVDEQGTLHRRMGENIVELHDGLAGGDAEEYTEAMNVFAGHTEELRTMKRLARVGPGGGSPGG